MIKVRSQNFWAQFNENMSDILNGFSKFQYKFVITKFLQ